MADSTKIGKNGGSTNYLSGINAKMKWILMLKENAEGKC
jgi:hypothetical protein